MHEMTEAENRWSRRKFLGALGLGAGVGLLAGKPRIWGAETGRTEPYANPYVYAFRIGEIEAWSISDGEANLGDPMHLMHPEEERPRMREALSAVGLPADRFPLYVNVLVLRIGTEVAIIDAGFGDVSNPRLGWVVRGLAQAGIAPEEVTAAFLSHAHSDHIDGFTTREEKPTFPNAAFYPLKAEKDFWTGPNPDFSKTKRDPRHLPGMVSNAVRRFEILAPQTELLESGADLFGGALTVLAAPGHTVGHAIYRIRSGDESLLHISDLAHHEILMFADPDWAIAFDNDASVAVATRRKEFARAAATRERVFGFHLPWPGIGRILAYGEDSYAWIPEPWHWL